MFEMKLFGNINQLLKVFCRYRSQRTTLGKPPELARSLKQRLEEINYKDPDIHYRVNIGFKPTALSRRDVSEERIKKLKENKINYELEILSRENKLKIPLEEVERDGADNINLYHIQSAAEHYGIFSDLFGDAFFTPTVNIDVTYYNDNEPSPVYRGNVLTPNEVQKKPTVKFKSKENSLWSLILTTPDGHLTSGNSEYILWMIGNIKGNNLDSGTVVRNYLQPFPLRGIGYCRYIFLLYKQTSEIDFSSLFPRESSPCNDPEHRTFSTFDFYKMNEDKITPAGLAFYQSEWDDSVTELFHNQFGLESPSYCYDFGEHYYTEQKWFPLKQPFNLYLDRYRDPKQIAKEFLVKKLKKYHPFKGFEPKLPYPNAVAFKKDTPSWLMNELKKERLGWGRVNDY